MSETEKKEINNLEQRENVEEKEEEEQQHSEHSENEKKENAKDDILFSYLEPREEIFKFEKNKFDKKDLRYENYICILLKNDDRKGHVSLGNTLEGLKSNLVNIKDNYAIFIMLNTSYNEYLFKDKDKEDLDDNNTFLCLPTKYKSDEKKENDDENVDDNEIKNIYVITGKNMTDINSLKCYYSIIHDIYEDGLNNTKIISAIITAGVVPKEDSLQKLINYCNHSKSQSAIAIAPIEYLYSSTIFAKICQYERIHFNLFNMNYYSKSYAAPISSLYNTMQIDDFLLKYLNDYYDKKISENATIDFHDYNLALSLFRETQKKYKIKYNFGEHLGTINNCNLMSYSDYKQDWINRHSGYYANFFEILRAFIDCSQCDLGEKLFLFFQIIAIAAEYILPSLFSIVIYSIFYEAFNHLDYHIALFFTLLYLSMVFASGVCSFVTKDPDKMNKTNDFLGLFMIVYYVFILACSVPAMHFINKKKSPNIFDEEYKFNKAAISVIIILTFIPYIIPFILSMTNIGKHIVNILLYIVFAAPSTTSIFSISKIWNAPSTSGGSKTGVKNAINIIIYLGFNLFFGSLSFYNTSRKKRANCVMGLAIIFLVYNFFRMLAIVIKLEFDKEEGIKKDLRKSQMNNIRGSNRTINTNQMKSNNINNEEKGEEEEEQDDRNTKKEKKEIKEENDFKSNEREEEKKDNEEEI